MSGIKQLLRPSICSRIDGLLSGLVTAIIEPPSCGKFEMWQAEQNLTLLDTNILSSPRPCDLCFFRSTTTTLHIRSCSLVFFQFAELSNTKYLDAMYLAWGWEKVLRIHSCPLKVEYNIGNGQLSDVTWSAHVMGRYLANAIVSDKSK